MINIDYALRVYTDMVNAEDVDIEYFKSNLSDEDFLELQELTPFIDMLKSSRTTQQFESIFAQVDEFKQEMFGIRSVANFRSNGNADTNSAEDVLNRIFEEEFPDE